MRERRERENYEAAFGERKEVGPIGRDHHLAGQVLRRLQRAANQQIVGVRIHQLRNIGAGRRILHRCHVERRIERLAISGKDAAALIDLGVEIGIRRDRVRGVGQILLGDHFQSLQVEKAQPGHEAAVVGGDRQHARSAGKRTAAHHGT